MIEAFALYLSFLMAVFLFAFSYIEGIKLMNSEGKVSGGTFIFSVTSAFLFSAFTYNFM